MAKRINTNQLKQAINKYNNNVRKYNNAVKKAVNDYNRQVNSYNAEVKRKISNYNKEVRKFNTEQERNRLKLNQSIRAFNNSKNSVRISTTIYYRESVERLEKHYYELDYDNDTNYVNIENHPYLFEDYPTQETNNSIQLYNSLNGIDAGDIINPLDLQKTYIEEKLDTISFDLSGRWKGALYSLSPLNPDAGRHFCTSTREIFTEIFDIKAPNSHVLAESPNCQLHLGKPSRKAKISYILNQKNIDSNSLENFINSDIEEILSLYRELNEGTHGSIGRFTTQQLSKLKKRVEDSISFLIEL